jgi:hypothetical protein
MIVKTANAMESLIENGIEWLNLEVTKISVN